MSSDFVALASKRQQDRCSARIALGKTLEPYQLTGPLVLRLAKDGVPVALRLLKC
ncbi:MAG: hypothetical protein AAF438_19285 [Pseudomonadota bacterium]